MGVTWVLKFLPYDIFGVYVYTKKLRGALAQFLKQINAATPGKEQGNTSACLGTLRCSVFQLGASRAAPGTIRKPQHITYITSSCF